MNWNPVTQLTTAAEGQQRWGIDGTRKLADAGLHHHSTTSLHPMAGFWGLVARSENWRQKKIP